MQLSSFILTIIITYIANRDWSNHDHYCHELALRQDHAVEVADLNLTSKYCCFVEIASMMCNHFEYDIAIGQFLSMNLVDIDNHSSRNAIHGNSISSSQIRLELWNLCNGRIVNGERRQAHEFAFLWIKQKARVNSHRIWKFIYVTFHRVSIPCTSDLFSELFRRYFQTSRGMIICEIMINLALRSTCRFSTRLKGNLKIITILSSIWLKWWKLPSRIISQSLGRMEPNLSKHFSSFKSIPITKSGQGSSSGNW
jgi:hypothetical protein